MDPVTPMGVEPPANSGQSQEIPAVPASVTEGPQRDEKGHFLPGVSGNPAGPKPGYKQLSTLLLGMLEEVAEMKDGNPDKKTYKELLNRRVLKRAIEGGDMRAVELVYDRIEGGVPRFVDVTSKGEKLGVSEEAQALANAALDRYLKQNPPQ